MMDDAATQGQPLVDLRRGAGLTQAELARRVGTTQSAVARWERGAVAPSLRSVHRLAHACGYRVVFEPVDPAASIVNDEDVARLEANLALAPPQRLARATTAANFVLRARRAMVMARDGGR